MTDRRITEPDVRGAELVLTYLTRHEMRYMISVGGHGAVSRALDQATRQLTSGIPGVIAESIRFRLEKR